MTPRALITQPGDDLVGVRTPLELRRRTLEFADFSGLAPDADADGFSELLVTYTSVIPVPHYPAEWQAGHRRWPGIRPEAMWHPLFWLPERTAYRYLFEFDDGTTEVESDDAWAARVMLELTAAGLYDPASGTWQDILAVEGIDVDTPDGVERVRRWLDGADDDVLDRIDLTDDLAFATDPDWSADAVHVTLPELETVRWAVVADEALDQVTAIRDDGHGTAAERLESTALWCAIVVDALSDAPDMADIIAPRWEELLLDADENSDAAVDSVMTDIIDELTEMRDAYWTVIEARAAEHENSLENDEPEWEAIQW